MLRHAPSFSQVRPDEVIEPSEQGPVVIIIDCPSMEFVPQLVDNTKFTKYQTDRNDVSLLVMVHLSPMEVFQCLEYQAWRNE